MKRNILIGLTVVFCLATNLQAAENQDNEILGKETVKWIEDIPLNPQDLVGRVYVLSSNGVRPFPLSVYLPVEEVDEKTVRKSVIKKATSDRVISFGSFFSMSGQKDKAFEFQVVHGKRWTSSPKSREYEEAFFDFIGKFRNVDSESIKEVLMVQAVVKKKIWYKSYTKNKFSSKIAYWLNIGGEAYSSSSNYEEISQYGLVLVPIKYEGFNLIDIAMQEGVAKAIEENRPSFTTLQRLPSSLGMYAKEQDIRNVPVSVLSERIESFDRHELIQLKNKLQQIDRHLERK